MPHTLAHIAILGGGHMGTAIARGAVQAGLFTPAEIVVAEPDPARHPQLIKVATACATVSESVHLLAPDGVVLIAVKPQMFASVAKELVTGVGPRLVLSIMAGVTTAGIEAALRTTRVVRAMPNLAVSVAKGMTAIARGSAASNTDEEFARSLFAAIGETIIIPEQLMDAFTAVAGSGPAYLFTLAQAMEQGAIRAGFTQDQARQIVRQTICGAAAMLQNSSDPPAVLRDAVTSKGGTTAAALAVLQDAGISETIVRAILAARDRGQSIGSTAI